MTKYLEGVDHNGEEPMRCRWCRHVLAVRSGPGRPREFCSQRCRQWDWVARQRTAELRLTEGELVVTRGELDNLLDDLYVLACAHDDALADLDDLGPSATPQELRTVVLELLTAVRPLRDRSLRPAGERP
jgi:endogenous inhibitor of DNA gyrase (YacG/DUF329 family)